MTPGDYARQARLQRAAAALTAGDEPIAAIAVRFGFSDQSHFSRLFRRQAGVSPGEYRRIARG